MKNIDFIHLLLITFLLSWFIGWHISYYVKQKVSQIQVNIPKIELPEIHIPQTKLHLYIDPSICSLPIKSSIEYISRDVEPNAEKKTIEGFKTINHQVLPYNMNVKKYKYCVI